ncbi:MAG: F0F1 ATP synthase subunit A [Actinomycetia bacterium]|nr:F0F1 ATP synthase subunit A [Actinomycetes bacterium]MCP4960223.1 F0F1 ATP synthase subunit A [Actinomycetes bacterium]
MIFGLEFPTIDHLVEWPSFWGDGEWHTLNKIGLSALIATATTLGIYFIAASKAKTRLVPSGVQTIAEVGIEFIDNGIIDQTMGEEGRGWNPFLLSIFSFVLITNMFEIIPGWQMPGNARMAFPALLAIVVWLAFIGTGIKHQGPGYFKNAIIPPGVPGALLPLVALIEFVSTFLVRPFSLAVRLFANMLAGHILLVTFVVLCESLWTLEWFAVFLPLPFIMLVLLTGFELMVAFLQAYIFTILAAVYIGSSMHADH